MTRKFFARVFLRDWALVAVSEAVRKDLLEAGCGFRHGQVKVISNAIDFDAARRNILSRKAARNTLGLGEGWIVGSIGRLVPKKNYEVLLRAAAFARSWPYSVVLIGDGRDCSRLQQLAQELGVGQQVKFFGTIPEAYRYIKAFDIFVLPSREEAFGMVLLEAISAGVPALGANAGGIPEVLGDPDYLFPVGDPVRLGAKLNSLLSSEKMRVDLASRQYQRAKRLFDIPVYERQWSLMVESGVTGALL